MSFSEKLQKARKENNLTQEGLADKLNVSRQAVSKWESGMAYPDTEKLIQISKLFHISLDELINDNKTIPNNKDNKKFDLMDTINIIYNFISKSFNMFLAMKFKDKIKLILEMGLLFIIIFITAHISSIIISELFRKIFIFIPRNILDYLGYLIDSVLYIGWLILGIIIMIKTFKTRYLDYYIVINDDSVKERVMEEPIMELKEQKEYKVVIRDPKDSSIALFKKFSKLIMLFIKCIGVFILISIIIMFIFFMLLLIFSLIYITNGLFFNGITITLLGIIIFIYLIIRFIYNLIFNIKNNYNLLFIIFIISISFVGIGLGLSFSALTTFNYSYDRLENTSDYYLDMYDNTVIPDIMNIPNDNIIIDNSINDIRLNITTYGLSEIFINNYYQYFDNHDYQVVRINFNEFEFKDYQSIINDLKNKEIKSYEDSYIINKIYISEDNLNIIKNNYYNLYN